MHVIPNVPLEELELDPENPRLPEDMQGAAQADILAYLYEHDVLDELAESYIANGFFPNEQLLVLPPDDRGRRIVVEGNRRLGALCYLLHTSVAAEADLPEHRSDYSVDPEVLAQLHAVPAIELRDREELASYLGFRHISGLKTWAPEAKARYLWTRVETAKAAGDQNPFYSVGRAVGSNSLGVRNAYRSYDVLRVARDDLGLRQPASYVLTNRFGVWTRLLGTANAADFMGVGDAGRSYEDTVQSTSTIQEQRVRAVLNDLIPQPGKQRALLEDSRDVTDYSAVLGDARAYEIMRRYDRLDIAADAARGSDLSQQLARLLDGLQLAVNSVLEGVAVDQDSLRLAASIDKSARNLLSLVQTNSEDSARRA